MAKNPKKRRGPARTTGPGTLVGLRCHERFLEAVDQWRDRQEDKPRRPAAIVRLAEHGLSFASRQGVTAVEASKASDMAGTEIDRLSDQAASSAQQASRKRRLLKGPKEFRGFRKDRHS
jgi:hypothetical protein